jgi:uncharacterized protein with HEPN domain
MRDETAFLFDMLDAAQLIQQYVTGLTRQQFDNDVKTQDAVIHRLTIIGEAAKKISQQTRLLLPTLPFDNMARMRDKVIHVYWRTEFDIVWDTASNDMQPLIDALLAMLPPRPGTP